MSGRSSVEKPHVEHEPRRSRRRRSHHCGPGHFFGLDAEVIRGTGPLRANNVSRLRQTKTNERAAGQVEDGRHHNCRICQKCLVSSRYLLANFSPWGF